nr:RING-H2 finger protein ATL7-like [Coffea arabica]
MSHSGRGGGIGGGGKTSISRYSDPQETATSAAAAAVVGGGGNASSSSSAELRLYQAFIFSVPIFFTFVLLSLFYLFCLRRRRLDWPSLTMPASSSSSFRSSSSRAETGGLKKEVREMLPVIVFKESFSVKDMQCSVCLGDYQAEERLQQIPACGHTFHRDCIDSWLSTHTTCPLCRQSLLVSAKASIEAPDMQLASHDVSSNIAVGGELSPENGSRPCEDSGQENDSCNTGERILTRRSEEEERGVHNIDDDTEMMRSGSER